MDSERYYAEFAAAYVRGRTPGLDDAPAEAVLRVGREAGLRLHRFKRTGGLQRVRKVMGILRGLAPADLLDVGSGRGAFLWPLLEAFAELQVQVAEIDQQRAEQLEAVSRGGIDRLRVHRADVTDLPFADDAVDVATVLEVLEHLVEPAGAAAELVRVARRFVIASVPSRPDDNPGHIQLFDERSLSALFLDAGARRVDIQYVHNHMIAVVVLP